ncbi:MAG: hypothetical protein K0R55_1108 [Sporomusa sp.]|jgi:predicted hydrocarbon binding protein|nr:hypothetical protein [Sporomusa sp.]
MPVERRYPFSWRLLGDIPLGRPNLGGNTRLEVYRLMQFALRDVLERQVGTEQTDRIFYEAGYFAGNEFYQHFIGEVKDFHEFIRQAQIALRDMGIGILRVEKADLEQSKFILTVGEDLECSGMPELNYEVCVYDEGFIAALMERFSGNKFKVKEVDCWCTGERICRFSAELEK